MRNILILITFAFLASCGPKMQERVTETFSDGKPKRVQYFSPDLETGYLIKEVFFYENGQKKVDGFYNQEGKKHGKWIYWREDGKKWSEGYFFEGKDDKLRKTWHENGQKHYQGKYDKGTRIGIWRFWDENGRMVKEINYDKEGF